MRLVTAFALAALCIATPARTQDRYELVARTGDGDTWYLDLQTLTFHDNGVALWAKGQPTRGSGLDLEIQRLLRANRQTGRPSHLLQRFEILCDSDESRITATTVVGDGGERLLQQRQPDATFELIEPETFTELLRDRACGYWEEELQKSGQGDCEICPDDSAPAPRRGEV